MSGKAFLSHRRRGVSLVATMVTMPLMLGFVGLAVDVGMSRSLQADLQRTADAAALAAAQDLGGADPDASMAVAQATVLSYVIKNPVFDNTPVHVDPAVDIVFGQASLRPGGGGKVDFIPNILPPGAIQVTVHATLGYTFARVLGLGERDLSATATAGSGPRDFVAVIDVSLSMTWESNDAQVAADLDALGIPYDPDDIVESALALTYDGSDPQFASVYNIGDDFLPPSVSIQPLRATKEAAAFAVSVVENAGYDDLLAAVAFSGDVVWTEPLTTDYARVRAKILGAQAVFRTRLDLAIRGARIELLSDRGRPGAEGVIVLMTDGVSDADLALTQAQIAVNAGITIHTVGLGGGVDRDLLDSIAAMSSDGQALYVPNNTDPSVYGPQLAEIFESLAGEVGYMLIR